MKTVLPARSITAELVRERFNYDPLTGILFWKTHRCRAGVGREAGCITQCGYKYVRLAGRNYPVHRIIWLWLYGSWPAAEVDHRDGDPLNNSQNNLRAATSREQKGNAKLRRDNTVGFKGVCRVDRQKNPYRAYVNVAGRQRHLGVFATPEAAHEAYATAAKELFGEFSCMGATHARKAGR